MTAPEPLTRVRAELERIAGMADEPASVESATAALEALAEFDAARVAAPSDGLREAIETHRARGCRYVVDEFAALTPEATAPSRTPDPGVMLLPSEERRAFKQSELEAAHRLVARGWDCTHPYCPQCISDRIAEYAALTPEATAPEHCNLGCSSCRNYLLTPEATAPDCTCGPDETDGHALGCPMLGAPEATAPEASES